MKYVAPNGILFHFDENKISLNEFVRLYSNMDTKYFRYLHNDKGPAIDRMNFSEKNNKSMPDYSWYIDGLRFSFEEWLNRVFLPLEEKVEFKLKYTDMENIIR